VLLEASDAESGERVFTRAPYICVIDYQPADRIGIELARRVLAHDGCTHIMFSMNDDRYSPRERSKSAPGAMSQNRRPDDLVEAIREVGKGGTYLPPQMARKHRIADPRSPRTRFPN